MAASALCTELSESAIVSMDRASGLGLTYVAYLKPDRTYPAALDRILARNQWLYSYLHLLARLDIVADISRLSKSKQSQSTVLANQWSESLPFDRSAVSALRAILCSARPEHYEQDFSIFLDHIGYYINVSPYFFALATG